MDTVLLHMLGYLTEAQWLDALTQSPGLHSRDTVKDYARQVYEYYPCLGWEEKTLKKLDLPLA